MSGFNTKGVDLLVIPNRQLVLKFAGMYKHEPGRKYYKDCECCLAEPEVLAHWQDISVTPALNHYFCIRCEVILLRSISYSVPLNLVTALLRKISLVVRGSVSKSKS